MDGINFQRDKEAMLNSLSQAVTNHEMRWPAIKGIQRQMQSYSRENDKKIAQDIVMTLAQLAFLERHAPEIDPRLGKPAKRQCIQPRTTTTAVHEETMNARCSMLPSAGSSRATKPKPEFKVYPTSYNPVPDCRRCVHLTRNEIEARECETALWNRQHHPDSQSVTWAAPCADVTTFTAERYEYESAPDQLHLL